MYIYQADVWCDDCAELLKDDLRARRKAPADEDDETSYDSDDFPKGPYANGAWDDHPNHCAAGEDCATHEYIEGFGPVGALLTDDLSPWTGVEYVRDSEGPLADWWRWVFGVVRETDEDLGDDDD